LNIEGGHSLYGLSAETPCHPFREAQTKYAIHLDASWCCTECKIRCCQHMTQE
jgi:hypothetical protein